jgi:photosystem II stability/assembly factor-like uncharacterized protein
MSGRVTAIDVDLRNPDRIYIGAASGGIWLSEDGGVSWKPIFDEADIHSIGALKIDPTNSDIIYAGTGEGNPRNSHTSGAGIFKSLDRGKTWKCMGLEKTKLIHRILINPQRPNLVYVGALGAAWGPNKERGLFRSKDGGTSWENILYINDSTGIADLVMDPGNPNKIIAATWQFYRTPWTFHSGGPGSGMHLSWDGGDSWRKITSQDGLPKGDLGRIGIAISRSKPNIIYALVEAKKNGLYKSTDGGEKWRLVSSKNIGNRPFYYAEFYVDPINENRLFNLHTYMTISEDGGKTFRNVLDYSTGVHPDHHAFWIHPEDPSYMIDGNDGGIVISRDGGASWRHVANLPVGQFYHVSIDEQVPFNVYGGMQDNGSWYGPSSVYKRGGIRNQDWREMYFGDGFDVLPLGDGSRFLYAMSQGGNVALVDKVTGDSKFIKPVHPDGNKLRFNWNAAIAADPRDENGLYFGSQYVHHSADRGKNWKIISPDLTTNDTLKQKQDKSGGLTLDATAAENYTTILCIEPDPFDEKTIWVGTDDGNLQKTIDGGQSWTEISNLLPGLPQGSWIPQIRHSLTDKNEIFLVANDYRRNDWSAYAYRSRDNGLTWQRLLDDQDVQGHCHTIIQDPMQSNLLFLGTERGLYYSYNDGTTWNKWTCKFPSVPVRDLQISKKEHSLVVGTFGRAIWILDDLTPLRFLAKDNLDEPDLLQGQDAYSARIKAADGVRFTANGIYQGSNRGNGLFYYVYMPAPEKEKNKEEVAIDSKRKKKSKVVKPETDALVDEKNKKPDSKIKLVIFDHVQDTMLKRELKYHVGINRYRWSMRRQGPFGPSRKKRKTDDLPARWTVPPGEYKLLVSHDDFRDSAIVRVWPDPRLPEADSDFEAMRAYQDQSDDIMEKMAQGTDQLAEILDQIKLSESLLVNLPDSTKKDWQKRIKNIRGQIDSLYLPVMGPENEKGIDAVTPKLVNDIYGYGAYIAGAADSENGNLNNSFNTLIRKSNQWLEQVNQFVTDDWMIFMTDFVELDISPFKEVEVLEKIDEK